MWNMLMHFCMVNLNGSNYVYDIVIARYQGFMPVNKLILRV